MATLDFAKIKIKLLYPLTFLIFMAALCAAYLHYSIQLSSLHQQKGTIAPAYLSNFESMLEDSALNLSTHLMQLEENDQIQKAFFNQNREELARLVDLLYSNLNQSIDLTHLYFIKTDGTVLYRAHNPKRHSDKIGRYTFQQTKQMNRPFHGVEFGTLKQLTLRVVHPWIIDGETMGFVEMGKEVDRYMTLLSSQLGIEMYLAVNKEMYADSMEQAKKYDHTADHYIVYQTEKTPENIEEILTDQSDDRFLKIDERVYVAYHAELKDASGTSIGHQLILIDVTSEYRNIFDSAVLFSAVIALIVLVMLNLTYLFIRREETQIGSLTKQLADKSFELESINAKLEEYLNENRELLSQYKLAVDASSIVSKTDLKGVITYVNDAFCAISGYTREELLGQPHNIVRHPGMPASSFENLWETIQNREVWQGIVKNQKKNGDYYIVETTVVPICDGSGQTQEYISIRQDITELIDLKNEIIDTQKEIIYTLGELGESRSKETGNHVKRVAEYSYVLALGCGLPASEADLIRSASPMHDIGKIAIPDSILLKPAELTVEEFSQMKEHAEYGYNIFKNSSREILKAAAIIARQHHERWDGAGYPQGLKQDEIHIYGRIVALADVFDALSSERVYKKAWPLEEVLEYIREEKDGKFDPNLVDVFFKHLEEIKQIFRLYP